MTADYLRRLLPAIGVAATLGVAASACGSTPATKPVRQAPTTLAKPAPTTTPTTAASAATTAAVAAITSTWTKFFSYKTPETTRIALLQNGAKYQSVIASVIGAFPKGLAASVTKVQPTGSTSATVTYTLTDSSGVLMSGLTGMAVKVGGKWLVTGTTFCGLAALAGATTCPS
ncbi:MAG: hypothetical protein ACRDX8_05240 [Acidimicrobiales bacterium]